MELSPLAWAGLAVLVLLAMVGLYYLYLVCRGYRCLPLTTTDCPGNKPHHLVYVDDEELAALAKIAKHTGKPCHGIRSYPPKPKRRKETRTVGVAGGEEVSIPVPDPAHDTAWNFANAVERETGLTGPFHLQYQFGTRESDQPAVMIDVGSNTRLPRWRMGGMQAVADMDDVELVTQLSTPMAQFDTTDPRYGEVAETAGWVVDPTMQGEERYFDLTDHEIARHDPRHGTVRDVVQYPYPPNPEFMRRGNIQGSSQNYFLRRFREGPYTGQITHNDIRMIEAVLVPNSGPNGEDQWWQYHGYGPNKGRLGARIDDPFDNEDLYDDLYY